MGKRVAIVISGRGSNMAALIAAAALPGFPARIAGVISNRPDAAGLIHADDAGLPTRTIDHRDFGSKAEFEAALEDALADIGADIVCLAGFMRILSAPFVERWAGRALNIHPSLLPSFRGLDTHARALAEGVRIHGCTVQFLSAAMDAGPIIAQAAVPVLGTDTPDTLAARVLQAEHILYPHALRMVADGRARLSEGRVLLDGSATETAPLIVPALQVGELPAVRRER